MSSRIATATAISAFLLSAINIASINIASVSADSSVDGGFQSGPSPGSFYSGGMKYNSETNTVFMTGSHYNTDLNPHDGSNNDLMQGTELDGASSCYVASLDFEKLFSNTNDKLPTFHSLSSWESYGNPGAIETCSALDMKNTDNSNKNNLYVVGSVGEGGMFAEGLKMEGLLSVLDSETLEFLDATLFKSAEDPTVRMVYPVDILHDRAGAAVYIAALTSTDDVENELPTTGNTKEPNWQDIHKYGSSTDITIIKIRVKPGEKPEAQWVQHFPVDLESDGVTRPPVFVGGLLVQKDTNGIKHLLVSGSTRGTGTGYGDAEADSKDEDGFIMQLDPNDGTVLREKRHKGEVYEFENKREGTGSDDFIRGMCKGSKHASDTFYIVGGTKGDMTTNDQGIQNDINGIDNDAGFQFGIGVENKYRDLWARDESLMPFLRQVSFSNDLSPNWTTQWAAMPDVTSSSSTKQLPTAAYAMDCVIDEDIGAIYIVGDVLKGGKMSQGDVEMTNQGGDDIWVAKVDETTGNVYWLTQLGSMDNEKLARYGSIAINADGNVLVYGDTYGNMYRQRGANESSETSDMFLMTVDGPTGAVLDNFYLGGTSSASVATTINGVPDGTINHDHVASDDDDDIAPVPAPPERTAAPIEATDIEWEDPDTSKNSNNNNNSNNVTEKKKSKAGLVFGIIAVIFGGIGAFVFFYSRQIQKKSAESQKTSIFSCLQKFDVEDIDLRRSPPGGWHGTYMNRLAYGVNNAENNDDTDMLDHEDGDDDFGGMAFTTTTSSNSSPSALYKDDNTAPLTHSSVANDALFMDDSATPSLGGGGGGGYRDNNNNFQIDEEDEVDIRLNSKII